MINLIKKFKNYLLILFPFFVIRILYLNFIPLWDARSYFDNCLVKAVEIKFNLFNFSCFGHPSFGYMFLLGLTQYLDKGNWLWVNFLNIILGLVAIFIFYRICLLIFGKKYEIEVILLTLIFSIHPLLTSNSLNLNLDFGVLVFFLLTLFFLLNERFLLTLIFSIFLVFSKESGLIIYSFLILVYLVIFVTREKKPFNKKYLSLFLPMLIFFIYYKYSKPVWMNKELVSFGTIESLFQMNLLNKVFQSYFHLLFTLNFNWIFTLLIIIFSIKILTFFIFNKKIKKIKLDYKKFFVILFTFIFSLHVFFSFKTFSNSRYFLPLLPLFLVLSFFSLISLIKSKKIIRLVLTIFLILVAVCNFRTIDPLAKKIYKTFMFGSHPILKMTSLTGERAGYGRDQLVYNLEFTNFHYIQNAIYKEIRPINGIFIVSHAQAKFFFEGILNRITFQRTTQTTNSFQPKYTTVNYVLKLTKKPKELYFIDYPNFDNQEGLSILKKYYNIEYLKFYFNNKLYPLNKGYYIGVYKMRLKDKQDNLR